MLAGGAADGVSSLSLRIGTLMCSVTQLYAGPCHCDHVFNSLHRRRFPQLRFAFGARSGVRTTRMPASPHRFRTARLHFRSRSQISTRWPPSTPSSAPPWRAHSDGAWTRARGHAVRQGRWHHCV